ncbi:MAG TPA: cation acetate symporter [Tepidisphaeraceae bacterium]|nr:cation acetate symporter [Tepidisphaeraceae bacterium]
MSDKSLSITIFLLFTAFTLGLSFWLARKAKSSAGYFAAHGQVGWFVNGIAFAGDYLSAASFLGICGMIAFFGYDGFLYSIGFLAGWVVALFVIAEPIKKLGKYTFADALDAKFGSRGIRLTAAISTLVVSVFYLIPQMVGAGSLLKALLDLPDMPWHGISLDHALGVVVVGGVVMLIVTTAGMVSTTWVQFIKGSLLVIFCAVLVGIILNRGIRTHEVEGALSPYRSAEDTRHLRGTPSSRSQVYRIWGQRGLEKETGSLNPIEYIDRISSTEIVVWNTNLPTQSSNTTSPVAYSGGDPTFVSELLLPGGSPTFKGIRSPKLTDKLDFISLMLALFCGTASLPHILIRYYTVKDAASARKSTVVGIAAIGFFYMLTLYIGLGAMVSGNLNPNDSNMSAPLLAKTFGKFMFAGITAIAFTTVLGTVSGLILAAAGAVARDLAEYFRGERLEDRQQVKTAKIAAIVVGVIAMILGVWFKPLNVTFLVGWAFNVAASANLPALVMLLFWRGTTRQGIVASISVGLVSSLVWLLMSAPAYKELYGLDPTRAIVPFSQPGLVTIPLAWMVLVIVSLITKRDSSRGFEVMTNQR